METNNYRKSINHKSFKYYRMIVVEDAMDSLYYGGPVKLLSCLFEFCLGS